MNAYSSFSQSSSYVWNRSEIGERANAFKHCTTFGARVLGSRILRHYHVTMGDVTVFQRVAAAAVARRRRRVPPTRPSPLSTRCRLLTYIANALPSPPTPTLVLLLELPFLGYPIPRAISVTRCRITLHVITDILSVIYILVWIHNAS